MLTAVIMELQKACYLLTQKFNRLSGDVTQEELNDFLLSFFNTIKYLENHYSRQEIRMQLDDIRKAVGTSPFVKNAQEWPRGYPGDFQTIDHIISGENKASPGTLGHAIEAYFLQSPVCEQHRSKITEQARLVKQVIEHNSDARILSIGCGTSEDLYQCLPVITSSGCLITLVDIDAEALQYSAVRLLPVKDRLTLIKGNIYKVIKQLDQHFDLILIGGVFDYLQDKIIIALLNELVMRLQEKGILFFTNIAAGNPFRISMEYLANWDLIERNETNIAALLSHTAAINMKSSIRKDATGLTYLITLAK
jgi:extracellular factor (EF) 3-hydroxypalmitic acid methyl ester biosynthesis protein